MPTLYVVATPIGNLSDISPRVRETLAAVDLVAVEDTRVAMKLLNALELSKPTVSCHRHNEQQKAAPIIEKMISENIDVALTCDAGTPAISDPGQALVDAAWEAGVNVIPISGPSATVTALSACGFDAREFAFYGFLPREKKPLHEKLMAIWKSGVSIAVAYESPHRIVKLTEQICASLPGCRIAVCCDLTKKYEKILRGGCEEVLAALQANPNVEKGEYCVVIDMSPLGEPPEEKQVVSPLGMMFELMMDGMSISEAAQEAIELGCGRNEVYQAKIRLKEIFEEEDE